MPCAAPLLFSDTSDLGSQSLKHIHRFSFVLIVVFLVNSPSDIVVLNFYSLCRSFYLPKKPTRLLNKLRPSLELSF